jgi:ankyrin repeat protein
VAWKGVARLQLDNEASWRAKLIDGITPLQVAVEKGHAAVVETLLSGGVDANVAAAHTSLVALASGKKRSDIVALLVNAGGRRTA